MLILIFRVQLCSFITFVITYNQHLIAVITVIKYQLKNIKIRRKCI